MKRVGIEVSFAAAEAVKLADVDVIAAYPITPQTHIVERLSKMVANGELDAEYICVESEHSALSACLGASASGARAYTATAAQGLELMHEVLYVASGMRLPVVMTVANRALSAPLSIWCDHSDAMSTRDTGWIQMFVENGQELYDLTLCSFKIAESSMLPTMVHVDGFSLTHVIEPIWLMDKSEFGDFLPKYKPSISLDPDHPVSLGCYALPSEYTEAKMAQNAVLMEAKGISERVWKEFGELTGRVYKPLESYRMEDAEIALALQGSFAETASLAVDRMRGEGKKVGLIMPRLWRPFPFKELREAVKDLDVLVVLDRCLSFGSHPPLGSEIRSALYREPKRPQVVSFVGGLGGRDISPEGFERIIEDGSKVARVKPEEEFEIFGLRR